MEYKNRVYEFAEINDKAHKWGSWNTQSERCPPTRQLAFRCPLKSQQQRKKQGVFFFHYFTLTVCNITEDSEVYIIEWVIPIENFGPVSLFMASPLSIYFKI